MKFHESMEKRQSVRHLICQSDLWLGNQSVSVGRLMMLRFRGENKSGPMFCLCVEGETALGLKKRLNQASMG